MCPMIYNPVLPYIGHIGGYLSPGNVIRIQGTTHPGAQRFALNLQCGPSTSPRDDVALHLSPDFNRGCIVRNSILGMGWGPEESQGHFPLSRGQPFDIMILCEHQCYKIAINGQHYTVFEHRIPYNRVTHFAVDGDISITSIEYGGGLAGNSGPMPGQIPMPGQMPMPCMPMPGHMPMAGGPGPGYPGTPGMYQQSTGPSLAPQSYGLAPHSPQPYGRVSPGLSPHSPQPYGRTSPSPLYPTQNPQAYPASNNYPAYKKPSILEQATMAAAGTAIGAKLLGKH